jgi:hypothetical protein
MSYIQETDREYTVMVFNIDGTLIDQRKFFDEREARAYQLQESMKGNETQLSHRSLLIE